MKIQITIGDQRLRATIFDSAAGSALQLVGHVLGLVRSRLELLRSDISTALRPYRLLRASL